MKKMIIKDIYERHHKKRVLVRVYNNKKVVMNIFSMHHSLLLFVVFNVHVFYLASYWLFYQ